MKTYKINLLEDDAVKQISTILFNISQAFETQEFKEFLVNKCQIELEKICIEKLRNLESFGEQNHYMNGMFVEIDGDRITLGNESIINPQTKNMTEETKARYSNELSLAKIVEFGVGSLGTNDESWQVNVNQQEHINKYGKDGWYYIDDNGILHWTKGIEGKLIFFTLENKIYENISNWIIEYIENEMRD